MLKFHKAILIENYSFYFKCMNPQLMHLNLNKNNSPLFLLLDAFWEGLVEDWLHDW